MKLLPSQHKFCVHHTTCAPCHFMQSHIRKVYVNVTCHLHFWQNDQDLSHATAVTQGWYRYRNKSQHRKLTLEKKILLLLPQGFEPTTFQSQVRRSNHWAILLPVTVAVHSQTGYSAHWLLHGWCWFSTCSEYTIQPCSGLLCHFIHSKPHVNVHRCLAVTCHLHFWQNDWDLLCDAAVTHKITFIHYKI